ncbi:hypothetical protein DXG01_009159 [Tephrocybe rancida]|nr:hypothetical protein DXG01_009159 [Tephrocybe rancida]
MLNATSICHDLCKAPGRTPLYPPSVSFKLPPSPPTSNAPTPTPTHICIPPASPSSLPAAQALPLVLSPNLCKQHFGVAEGERWVPRIPASETTESMIAKEIYHARPTRQDKYEGGESLDCLAARVEEVVVECMLSHAEEGREGEVHVTLASHRWCISNYVKTLLRMNPEARLEESKGLDPTNKEDFLVHFAGAPIANFNISLPAAADIVESRDAVYFYQTTHGFPWKNECTFTITYSGDLIKSVTEFADPTLVKEALGNEAIMTVTDR